MNVPDQLKFKRLTKGRNGSIGQDEFAEVIVSVLRLYGGSAKRQKMIETILDIYSTQFTQPDFELLTSQTPPKERWIHNVDWAKLKLVQQGILLRPSKTQYGHWTLATIENKINL